MDDVSAFLFQHAAAIAAGLLLLVAAVVLALLAFYVRRSLAPPATTAAVAAVDPLGRQAVRDAVDLAMDHLRQLVPGRRRHYVAPWYLMLGEPGGGPGQVLRAVDEAAPFRRSADSSVGESSACAWWFLNGGIVIDVDAAMLADDDVEGQASPAWDELIAQVTAVRPERPLDGVVVAVPAAVLLAPGLDGRAHADERADRMCRRLWDLQRHLGLRLPVYLLVTGCDAIEGFGAFWAMVPLSRRQEIFGWSNAHAVDEAFVASQIDDAFLQLGGKLDALHLDFAASPQGCRQGDGALLFPAAFAALGEPLGLYLERLLRVSVYYEPAYFRGAYFVGGDGAAPPPSAALSAGAATPAAARAGTVMFAGDVFARKIFRETALATAALRGRLTRGRLVRGLQVSLAAFVVATVAAGWLGYTEAHKTLTSVTPALRIVASAVDSAHSRLGSETGDGHGHYLGGDDASKLLKQMMAVDADTLDTWALPSSWFSTLGARVTDYFAVGFNEVILKAMRHELAAKADAIMTAAEQPILAEGEKAYAFASAADQMQLQNLVEQLNRLDYFVGRYNRLGAKASLDDIRRLTEYLLGLRLGEDFLAHSTLYEQALTRVQTKPFDPKLLMPRATGDFIRIHDAIEKRLAPNGPIVKPFAELEATLDEVKRTDQLPQLNAALQRLRRQLDAAKVMLADPDFDWVASGEVDPSYYRTLVGGVGCRFFTGAINDAPARIGAQVRDLRAHLLSLKAQAVGPLLQLAEENGKPVLRLSPALVSLTQVLPPTLDRPFMTERKLRPLVSDGGAGVPVAWLPQRLDEAMGYYRDFEQFEAVALGLFPQPLRPTIDRYARANLRANLVEQIASAEVMAAPGRGGDRDGQLAEQVRNFRPVAKTMGDLLTVLPQLGFDSEYDDLREIVGLGAYGMLVEMDEAVERDAPYAPVETLDFWEGAGSALFAAFQVRDDVELAQYLDAQRGRVAHTAADMAEPLVDFLLRDDFTQKWRSVPLVGKWQRILVELKKYDRQNPRSSVAMLENFIRFDVKALSRTTCRERLGDAAAFADSGDFFLERRNGLRRKLYDRCRSVAAAEASSSYGRLAETFNATVAGRFPFAAGESDAGDADPEAVADLFRRFAADEPAIRRDLAAAGAGGKKDAQRVAVAAFLDRMAAAQAFLAPLLAPGDAPEWPSLDVAAEFRVNRAREHGGNQIIDWGLTVAGQTVKRGAEAKPLRWRVGDPAALALRWAKDGPAAPVLDGRLPALSVAERTATLAYGGPWALLRLLDAHAAKPEDFDKKVESLPHVLKVTVPTRGVAPVDAPTPEALVPATVFARVTLSAAGGAADPKARKVMPQFPRKAPSLAAKGATEEAP